MGFNKIIQGYIHLFKNGISTLKHGRPSCYFVTIACILKYFFMTYDSLCVIYPAIDFTFHPFSIPSISMDYNLEIHPYLIFPLSPFF